MDRGKSGGAGAFQAEGIVHSNTIFMSSKQMRSDQGS